ncbi:YdcH family protein [Flavobacterium sp.]|uniref:YdcH family protein n=1 Tax=Flavobacterium sp. TaxID=239 RepID=UPI0037BEF841
MITTHPIVQEFPEYLDKIKDLYHHNEEFQVLLGSYHSLDKEIFEIEKGEIPATDDELTHKRRDRVFLKDEIYNYLTSS